MSWSRSIALSTTLAVMALGTASAADQYQWEAALGYTLNTADTEPDETDTSTLLARGEYHFVPVKLGDHPWEEAAFLEHSTFAEAALGYLMIDDGDLDATGPVIGVGFTYATPEFPLRLAARLTHSQAEDSDLDYEVKATSIELEAGYWIMPNLVAGLRFDHTTTDYESDDETQLDIGAFGKWVHTINPEFAVNAEAELGQSTYDQAEKDSNIFLEVAGDLYFRQRYGIGLVLGTESGDADGAEGTTVGVRASAWFTENVGVRVGYNTFSVKDDDLGVDDDTLFIEIAGRF